MIETQTLEQKPNSNATAVPPSKPAPEPVDGGGDKSHARRTKLVRVGVVLGLVVVGLILWRVLRGPDIPDSVVALSGRIEGDDSAIASKTSGRILEVRYREGDHVNQGDVIATLDDEQIRARENQAQAAVAQAEARLTSSEQQIAILEQQLLQNRLQAAQSKEDAAGRVSQADADLAAAESDLAQQQSNLKLAEFDREAYTRLAKTGAVSERQGEEAVSKADAQAAAVAASRRRVEAARGALTLAKSSLANPAIRNSQTAAVERQIAQQGSEVAAAQFQLNQAKAQLTEAQANRQDLTIRAPFEGSIVTRTAEPGEVVAAGTAVVTLLDLSKVYLRGFIPEGQIGKVRLGQQARVFLDSSPNQPLEAYVSRIDPQATFTPENTYFRNDRVKQVVGVKLQLKSGTGYAKPGMPADGEVLVQGDSWPRHLGRP
ncbi:MAG: HlyD family efflux transporter periplasmic adaptor subunit [Terriglobales bacterium]|jgi:HlyD family secretion protein